jgi:hypothetical protein
MKKNKKVTIPVIDIQKVFDDLENMKLKLDSLISDTYTGKFGTKNRVELISRLQSIYLQL